MDKYDKLARRLALWGAMPSVQALVDQGKTEEALLRVREATSSGEFYSSGGRQSAPVWADADPADDPADRRRPYKGRKPL